jgi:hypothetical protein
VKVEVSIERDSDGRLHAYVLERGEDRNGDETIRKGADLLKSRFVSSTETARQECDGKLRDLFKFAPPTITYIYPDGQ